jgi:hypothetical protein
LAPVGTPANIHGSITLNSREVYLSLKEGEQRVMAGGAGAFGG